MKLLKVQKIVTPVRVVSHFTAFGNALFINNFSLHHRV